MLIEKCPICGSMATFPLHLYTARAGNHWRKRRWRVQCLDCGWKAGNALTEKGAWRKWNKAAKKVNCGTCAKWGSDECPNSALCYDRKNGKPYYKEKRK